MNLLWLLLLVVLAVGMCTLPVIFVTAAVMQDQAKRDEISYPAWIE